MKSLSRSFLFMLVLGLLFSCSNTPKGEVASSGNPSGSAAKASMSADNYTLNAAKSIVNWTGSKVIGGKTHMGSIAISEGSLSVKNGAIEAGSFTFDMNSLANLDMKPGEGKEKLEGHLKSGDFFEVATFPTAKFTISKVEAINGIPDVTHKISGDLKLKDVTKSISFNANIAIMGDNLTAVTPAFSINRTDWGVKYGSGLIGVVQDKAISDDVGLTISLDASKKGNS